MTVSFSKVSNLYSLYIHHQDFPRVWLKWVEPPIKLPSFQTKLVVGGTGILEGTFLVQFLFLIMFILRTLCPLASPTPEGGILKGPFLIQFFYLKTLILTILGPDVSRNPQFHFSMVLQIDLQTSYSWTKALLS